MGGQILKWYFLGILLMAEILHQLRLVVFTIIYRGFSTIPGGCLGFQPSTVVHKPQTLIPILRWSKSHTMGEGIAWSWDQTQNVCVRCRIHDTAGACSKLWFLKSYAIHWAVQGSKWPQICSMFDHFEHTPKPSNRLSLFFQIFRYRGSTPVSLRTWLWFSSLFIFCADTQLWFTVGCSILGVSVTLVQHLGCNGVEKLSLDG